MRVLFVVPGLSKLWGGITTSVLLFKKGLEEAGHSIDVVSVASEQEQADTYECILDDSSFRIFDLSMPAWRYSRTLSAYLEKHVSEYDIVHVHGMWTAVSLQASRAASRAGRPYVISPHGMLEQYALSRKKLKKGVYRMLVEKRVFKGASFVHCITEQESRNTKRVFGNLDTRIISNGVKVGLYAEKQQAKKTSLLFAGRLDPIKGLDRLLRAIVKYKWLRLKVAGTGDEAYSDYIVRLIGKLGLTERVCMLGFVDRDKMSRLYSEAMFTVVPSHSEVLSMVALESLAEATPVMVTRQCNFDEVHDHNAGIIIDDNSVESISEGLRRMLGSDLQRMSENAHELASKCYDYRVTAGMLAKSYTQVIESRQVSG